MSELVKRVVDVKMQRKVERAPVHRGGLGSRWRMVPRLVGLGYVLKTTQPKS